MIKASFCLAKKSPILDGKKYVPKLGIYQIPRESSSQAENALYGGPDGKILKLADFGLAVTGPKKGGVGVENWRWWMDVDGSKS